VAKIDELRAQEAEILGRPVYRLPAEAGVPDEVVAGRRAADNRKEAAPIRQQIAVLVRQRDDLAVKAAQIDHDIVMRWRQARSLARAWGSWPAAARPATGGCCAAGTPRGPAWLPCSITPASPSPPGSTAPPTKGACDEHPGHSP